MFFKKKVIDILSPVNGELISIEDVPDAMFKGGMLGKGVAVIPEENEICAPVQGIVTTIFPTGHAIGMTTSEGIELLIHVGINTVNLGGVGFEMKVQKGYGVKAGNVLLTVDVSELKRQGYRSETPIIICNPDNFKEIICTSPGKVKKGDLIMKVLL